MGHVKGKSMHYYMRPPGGPLVYCYSWYYNIQENIN